MQELLEGEGLTAEKQVATQACINEAYDKIRHRRKDPNYVSDVGEDDGDEHGNMVTPRRKGRLIDSVSSECFTVAFDHYQHLTLFIHRRCQSKERWAKGNIGHIIKSKQEAI